MLAQGVYASRQFIEQSSLVFHYSR
jgi:hypothetical protein